MLIGEHDPILIGAIVAINIALLTLGLREGEDKLKRYVVPFVFLSAIALFLIIVNIMSIYFLLNGVKMNWSILSSTLVSFCFFFYYLKHKFFG